MENQESISSLLQEHAGWQNRLSGFKNELNQLNDDLGKFLLKKEPRDIPSDAEHFQNQFILQKEVLDILKHDMKQYENLLELNLEKPNTSSAADIQSVRSGLSTRFNDYVKLLSELRQEFRAFSSEVTVAF